MLWQHPALDKAFTECKTPLQDSKGMGVACVLVPQPSGDTGRKGSAAEIWQLVRAPQLRQLPGRYKRSYRAADKMETSEGLHLSWQQPASGNTHMSSGCLHTRAQRLRHCSL